MILLILMGCGGHYFVFRAIQAHARKKINTQIERGDSHEELTFFNFTQTQFEQLKWIKPGKEFQYGNKLYDVVRIISREKHRKIICINDHFEKKLVDWNQKNNLWQKNITKLVKVYNYLANFNTGKWEFTCTLMSFRHKNLVTKPVFSIPSAPPPKHHMV